MAARLLIPMKCQHIRKKSTGIVGNDKDLRPRLMHATATQFKRVKCERRCNREGVELPSIIPNASGFTEDHKGKHVLPKRDAL